MDFHLLIMVLKREWKWLLQMGMFFDMSVWLRAQGIQVLLAVSDALCWFITVIIVRATLYCYVSLSNDIIKIFKLVPLLHPFALLAMIFISSTMVGCMHNVNSIACIWWKFGLLWLNYGFSEGSFFLVIPIEIYILAGVRLDSKSFQKILLWEDWEEVIMWYATCFYSF